jgi:REP element-mobilizing transposase RayT
MPEEKKFPARPPRLSRVFDDSPLYFVTFNASVRQPLLATAAVHEAFRAYATKNQERGLAVGRYVIMPDHIHFFVRVGAGQKLDQYIRLMKQTLTKRILESVQVERVWQPGFFDHVMRSSESYSQKWNYVRMNPVRAGLVADPDDWEFQGELVAIFFE